MALPYAVFMNLILTIAAAVALVTLSACSDSRTSRNTPPVVDAIEIRRSEGSSAAQTGTPVVMLDVRTPAAFASERANGARLVPIAEWRKAAASPEASLSNAGAWKPRVEALGIPSDAKVLVYDAGEMTEAARAWFMLQHIGVSNVSVINGGWPSLRTTLPASAISSGVAEPVASVALSARGSDTPPDAAGVGLKTKEELKAILDGSVGGHVRVLDARGADEFAGTNAMTNTRAGHLPGAVNIPHLDLLEAGRLKSPAELRRMFEAAGLEPGDRIVTHCQGGGRASLAALALRRAGYRDVQNYYLSFGEWAADESCPIEPGR